MFFAETTTSILVGSLYQKSSSNFPLWFHIPHSNRTLVLDTLVMFPFLLHRSGKKQFLDETSSVWCSRSTTRGVARRATVYPGYGGPGGKLSWSRYVATVERTHPTISPGSLLVEMKELCVIPLVLSGGGVLSFFVTFALSEESGLLDLSSGWCQVFYSSRSNLEGWSWISSHLSLIGGGVGVQGGMPPPLAE